MNPITDIYSITCSCVKDEPISCAALLQPKVEGEVAFVLNRRLKGPGVTIADVLRATEGVMASIEIVDSRVRDWKIKLADTIADNASSARFVVGSRLDLPQRNRSSAAGNGFGEER